MADKLITSGVHYVGVSHYDRRFFDALVPTPEGTTYNAYLVEGKERNALIDTVEPEFKELFLHNLRATGVKKIDYIILEFKQRKKAISFTSIEKSSKSR